MTNRISILLAMWLGCVTWAYAQDEATPPSQDVPDTDTTYWTNRMKVGFNFNQAAFSDNWRAGGVNSIAFGGYLVAKAHYEKDKITWDNELDLQYGVVKNEGQGVRKNLDRILFDSKIGYRMSKNWRFFGSINFLTQFYNGYEYQEDAQGEEERLLISKFMNPAFLTLNLGFEYKPVDYFWLRMSPVSPRLTFVTDTTIYRNVPSNYGVDIGETMRYEWLAANILANLDKDIAENLNLKVRYALYANYENLTLEEIDHRLDLTLTAKINKLIDVNLAGILLYDKDQDEDIQLSQSLAIGIVYTLQNR